MNPAAARGAILVVVGLVVGAFILGQGLDDSTAVVIETGTDSGDTSSPAEEPAEESSTDAGDTSSGDTSGEDTTDAGTGETDEPGVELTPEDSSDGTALTPTVRPPAEVKVLVANGSGVQGAAGRATESLLGQGYNALSPVNAESQSETRLYYAVGFEADAQAIAQLLSAPPDRLAPMIDPPPGGVDLRGANVLVLLGPDEVSQPG